MKTSVKSHLGVVVGILGLAVAMGGTAVAADFHGQVDNPLQDIPAVAAYQTSGAQMAGMAVTAFFSAAPAETVVWQATGATSGAATGTDNDWRLSEDGDTFGSPWTLQYDAALSPANKGLLTGLSIDGFAAGPGQVGVMFDRTFNGDFGTPDSFRGWDYETQAPVPPFDTFVTYQGAVGVGGGAPVGDEFRWLHVRFRFLPAGGEFGTAGPREAGLDGFNMNTISFIQDTNNPIVPEPASLALLLGAVALRLRRRAMK